MGAAETAPLFKSHRRKAGHAGAFTLCKTDSLDKHYNLAQAIRSVPRDTLVVPARGTTYAKYGGGHAPFLRRQSFGAPDPRVQKAAGCRSGRDAAGGTGNSAVRLFSSSGGRAARPLWRGKHGPVGPRFSCNCGPQACHGDRPQCTAARARAVLDRRAAGASRRDGGIRQGWTSHRRLRRHGSLCADRTVATAARFRRYRAVLRFGGEFPRRASIVERLVCGTTDGVRSGEDG